MDYFITRDDRQYGPYSLADLQRYVASGEILVTDMARSEGMSEPMPVSQIVGSIPVPSFPPRANVVSAPEYPDPPNLHWALVLLFEIFTCGLFAVVWGLVEAAWMKSVMPRSRGIYYYIASGVGLLVLFMVGFAAGASHRTNSYQSLFQVVYGVLSITARFSLRSSLEEHFNSAEPIGLSLGGVMTFFFGEIYFQYHLNQINLRKRIERGVALSR